MPTRTDTFDLSGLRLSAGEGRQLELALIIEPFELGGHTYTVTSAAPAAAAGTTEVAETAEAAETHELAETNEAAELIDARLGVSRMTGQGYALHLTFGAALHGPCMRCLEPAEPVFSVDAREVSQPGEEDGEFESPYVIESIVDLGAWARDALALALGPALLCRPDCRGLCPVCGTDLNLAGPDHSHPAEPDSRWAALSELRFTDSEPGAGPRAGSDTGPGDPEVPAPSEATDSGSQAGTAPTTE